MESNRIPVKTTVADCDSGYLNVRPHGLTTCTQVHSHMPQVHFPGTDTATHITDGIPVAC